MDAVQDSRIEARFNSLEAARVGGYSVNWHVGIGQPNDDGELWAWCTKYSHNGRDGLGRVLVAIETSHDVLKAAEAWADEVELQLVDDEAVIPTSASSAQTAFWVALAEWMDQRRVKR